MKSNFWKFLKGGHGYSTMTGRSFFFFLVETSKNMLDNITYAKKCWINIAYVFIHYIYSGILRTSGKPLCSGPEMTEGESVRDVLLTDLTGPQLWTNPRVSRKVFAVGCRPSPSCWKGWPPWQYRGLYGKMCVLQKTNESQIHHGGPYLS